MPVSIRITKRPPPPQAQYKAVRDEIKKQLIPVGRSYLNEYKKAVANFSHKPDFETKSTVTEKQVTLSIVIKNSNEQVSTGWTISDLWKALDEEGTKPHDIKSKTHPTGQMRFLWGGPGSYQPKTRPIARSGGSGEVRNGKRFSTKRGTIIKHPGTKPRYFTRTIHSRLKRQYEQAIDRGIRQGLKKVNK